MNTIDIINEKLDKLTITNNNVYNKTKTQTKLKKNTNIIYDKLNSYFDEKNNEFTININSLPTIEEFENIINESTTLVAECYLNTSENFPSKTKREYYIESDENYIGKKVDYKAINQDMWNDSNNEWLYFITYNKHIVKIGMTESTLKKRFSSYNCGTSRAMNKGSCSTTNYIISECNFNAIKTGMKVGIYALSCSKTNTTLKRFGITKKIHFSSVREQEAMILSVFIKNYNKKPFLCVQAKK